MISKAKQAISLYHLVPICHIWLKNICSFPMVFFIYSKDSSTKIYSGIQANFFSWYIFSWWRTITNFAKKNSLIRNTSIIFCHFNNIIWMSLFQMLFILVHIWGHSKSLFVMQEGVGGGGGLVGGRREGAGP